MLSRKALCRLTIFAALLIQVPRAVAFGWDPVTDAEKSMKSNPLDPGAGAVVLFKRGQIDVIEKSSLFWTTRIQTYVRLKVFNDAGRNAGDASSATFEKHDDSGMLLLSGSLDVARTGHTSTELGNGTFFVAGGIQDPTSWEIIDPNGHVDSSGVLVYQSAFSAATLLTNGNVFIAGGNNSPGLWEVHSPTGALVASGSLRDARSGGINALTLPDGNVWISGSGFGTFGSSGSTYEIRDITGNLVSAGNLTNNYLGGQASVLHDGNVILLAGDACSACYEIRTQTGTLVSNGTLRNGYNSGVASALLANGNIFIFGSCGGGGVDATFLGRQEPGKYEMKTGISFPLAYCGIREIPRLPWSCPTEVFSSLVGILRLPHGKSGTRPEPSFPQAPWLIPDTAGIQTRTFELRACPAV